jgi:hypothetical protein
VRAGVLLSYTICVIVSLAALLNGASALLQQSAPLAALRLNPLNVEARINLAGDVITSKTEPTKVDLGVLAAAGIGLTPADARLYSLMGIEQHRAGDRVSATRYFDRALTLLPTEIQALSHKLEFAIQDHEFLAAIDYLEVIGRRWRKHWKTVEPVLPLLLADGPAYQRISERFSKTNQLRSDLIHSLGKTPDGLPFAYSLLLDWHLKRIADIEPLISEITWRLVNQKNYRDAFMLFRLTRPKTAAAEAGYIFNGGFVLPFSNSPFDWQISRLAGADIRVINFDEMEREGKGKALAIRFLNNPIRFNNMRQFVRLVPGRYTLAVEYSAKALRMPKPLKLSIGCEGKNKNIEEIPFGAGTTGRTAISADFTIPANGCSLQMVRIFNEARTDSWKNRYSGTLYLHRIAISAKGV